MTTWLDGVNAIREGHSSDLTSKNRWYPWITRIPIVVMGGPGAGKTAIWRRLTGHSAPDAMSTRIDQGYFGRARRRRNVAITTIPGQESQERYLDLDRYFGSTTMLNGVIFVASFGFDHIWSSASDATAAEIGRCDIEHLSDYNMRRELRAFQETCARIRQKHLIAKGSDLRPKWLLVLVNKVDLYWDAIEGAQRYYAPGCGSEFDIEAEQLLKGLGTLTQFQYEVLPMTLSPLGYSFRSNRGDIPIDSQLEQRHADASLQLLVDTLETLCEL